MDSRSERRGLIALAVAGVALLAIGGVALAGLRRVDRREQCLWQLSRIGMVVIAAEPRESAAWDRVGQGQRFFLDVADWPKPTFPIDVRWFCCPEVGPAAPSRIDYRGPASALRRMDRDDPIVADKPGNHGAGAGGNVVFRSGAAKSVPEADPAWVRAASSTRQGE